LGSCGKTPVSGAAVHGLDPEAVEELTL